jgi:hypothetical protein
MICLAQLSCHGDSPHTPQIAPKKFAHAGRRSFTPRRERFTASGCNDPHPTIHLIRFRLDCDWHRAMATLRRRIIAKWRRAALCHRCASGFRGCQTRIDALGLDFGRSISLVAAGEVIFASLASRYSEKCRLQGFFGKGS